MHSHNVLIGIPLREKPMKFSEVLMVMLASLMVNTPNNPSIDNTHHIPVIVSSTILMYGERGELYAIHKQRNRKQEHCRK